MKLVTAVVKPERLDDVMHAVVRTGERDESAV
jgi:nitrogen regulatory protein PII